MRHYELVTILSPMLNQTEATEAWDQIKNFITNREGEIVREQSWGTRRLAYPIRQGSYNFLEGSYYLTNFSTDTPFNIELETFLRLDERVLRSMVIAGDPPPPPAPTPEPVAAVETEVIKPVDDAADSEPDTTVAEDASNEADTSEETSETEAAVQETPTSNEVEAEESDNADETPDESDETSVSEAQSEEETVDTEESS
ncbi:MAG: 30S ribosomal protein S6 [Dehalococcoidia bacterium]|nr:30S ribosomal protein S6 [Dehalococcoidia bacterium]